MKNINLHLHINWMIFPETKKQLSFDYETGNPK